jgi:hypothetical protein
MGDDKVFDVISEFLFNKNLSQLLMDAAANARGLEEILKEIEIILDEDYIRQVKENLGESLAIHIIDYTHIKEIARQARENRLIPEYTESFFKKALKKLGGRFNVRQDGFLAIESIPRQIHEISQGDIFRKNYGVLLKKYPKATFDKEIAFKHPEVEFISFGHPLFEAVLNYIETHYSEAVFKGAVFTDPDGNMDGCILFYEGEIKDASGSTAGKRIFSFFLHDKNNRVETIPASIIWDLEEKGSLPSPVQLDLEAMKKQLLLPAISELEKYQTELQKKRDHQASIKEKYGVNSLDHLIRTLDGELIWLYDRRTAGENVDLVIRNKEERKKQYELSMEELKQKIAREKTLSMGTPRFLGFIRVVPAPAIDDEMKTSKEIEEIGIKIAMEYEKNNSRIPENVSEENLGFDIRSTAQDGSVRYIEVKARSHRGAVALTQNEWFKAHRFGDDYFLYVVMNAAQNPQLYIYRNPAKKLEPIQVINVVRYVIPFDQLKNKGEVV